MSGHTPGKWRWVSRAGGWDGVDAVSGEQICRLEYNNPENARLIAAAPDLLAALQAVCSASAKRAAWGRDNVPAMRDEQDALSRARTAIALATTGES